MKRDPKELAAIIIGKGRPEKEPEGDEVESKEEASDPSEELSEQSAQDMWDAIKGDDFDAFKSALKDYVDSCMG